MNIGAFSLSLDVKDIKASKEFYEKLGFKEFAGDINQKWLIMKNEDVVIGIFEGMLESNIMTFNPGWDNSAQNVDPFTDARELAKQYKKLGIEFVSEIEGSDEGPANFVIKDPDGNLILIDQHR